MATELGEDKRGELVDRSVASVVVPSSISGSWSCPSVISFAAPAFVGESRWIRGRCPHATSLPRGRNRRLDTALQLRLAGPEKEARGLSPDTESPFLGPGSIRPESCLKACLNRAMAGGMDAIFDYSSPLTQVTMSCLCCACLMATSSFLDDYLFHTTLRDRRHHPPPSRYVVW